jgi:hypothetical protein
MVESTSDMKSAPLLSVTSLGEIPAFASEDEEREWWAAHQMSEELYAQLQDVSAQLDKILPPVPRKARRAAG